MGFVFISYSWFDGKDFAEKLYETLRANGVPVWRDKRNLNPYQDFSAMIEGAIKQASHILVVLSPSLVDDEDSFVRREILYAQGCQKPIIPILLPGFPQGKIPTLVNHLTWIDFNDYQRGMSILLERLRQPLTAYQTSLDLFRDHLEELNAYILEELRRTVFNAQVLTLRMLDAPEAVEKAKPIAYQSRRAGWFVDHDTRVEFGTLERAFEFHGRRLLLLGEPGAGKTTTLLAYAQQLVNARLQNSDHPLPIYAPIHTWDGKMPLLDWLAGVTDLERHDLQVLLETDRAVLLLDGLDELPVRMEGGQTTDYRVAFMAALEQFGTTPLLITCRYNNFEAIMRDQHVMVPLNGAVLLKPLSNRQIEIYLEPLPGLWEALSADLQLMELARTPLILTLLTVAYQDAGEHALWTLDNRTGLLRDQVFKVYVTKRYEFEQVIAPLSYTIGQIYLILGQVAMTSLLWGNEQELELSLFRHVLSENADEFIEFAVRLHYIRPVRQGVYRFMHGLLRDHFAVPYCMSSLNDKNTVVRHGAALVLAKIGDARAVEPLTLALRDESAGMRKLAASALGEIGDVRAVGALKTALDDSDKWVRSEAAIALGKIADPSSVDALIEALHDSDKSVCANAAVALGRIGDSVAIEPLLHLFTNEDEWVRRRVILTVAEFGEPALERLSHALEDEQALIRQGAIVALVEIGARQMVTTMKPLLEDADEGVRATVVWALEQLEHDTTPEQP
ncbi:MAG: HEAT repeat domain-containing protein [Anaerolineales bacterium]|nr:HEAT repeat domain-containing protein [Anaerolineales bacterium]